MGRSGDFRIPAGPQWRAHILRAPAIFFLDLPELETRAPPPAQGGEVLEETAAACMTFAAPIEQSIPSRETESKTRHPTYGLRIGMQFDLRIGAAPVSKNDSDLAPAAQRGEGHAQQSAANQR